MIRELLKRFWAERKAERALKTSAQMLEKLAFALPNSALQEMYPGEDPIKVRNNIILLAHFARKI
jgi:hypothetical protein